MVRILLLMSIIFSMIFGQSGLPSASTSNEPVSNKQLIDSSQFIADRIVQSKVPVLVDFWAAWCGPCRLLSPTIDELKKEYAGKILVMKVNVDIHRGLSAYFRISSIPAVFIIANRAVVDYLPGLQPKVSYTQAIEKALSNSRKSPKKEKKDTSITQPSGSEPPMEKPAPSSNDK
jgi:thioredoxin 1